MSISAAVLVHQVEPVELGERERHALVDLDAHRVGQRARDGRVGHPRRGAQARLERLDVERQDALADRGAEQLADLALGEEVAAAHLEPAHAQAVAREHALPRGPGAHDAQEATAAICTTSARAP